MVECGSGGTLGANDIAHNHPVNERDERLDCLSLIIGPPSENAVSHGGRRGTTLIGCSFEALRSRPIIFAPDLELVTYHNQDSS